MIHLTNELLRPVLSTIVNDELLGARNNPFVTIPDSCCLQACNIAASEGLADSQTDKLLPGEDLGNYFGFQLRGTVVQHRWETDDLAGE